MSNNQDEQEDVMEIPKQNKGSYFYWFQANRDQLTKEVGQGGQEMFRHAGKVWKQMDEKAKKKWEKVAAKDKERYQHEKAEFESHGNADPDYEPSSDEDVKDENMGE